MAKILIVDDNVSIQEILTEILGEEKHEVDVASSLNDAMNKTESMKPDLVFLDTNMGNEMGIHLLSRLNDADPELELKVILVKGLNEQMPKDKPAIVAVLNKPFTTEDVLKATDYSLGLDSGSRGSDSKKKEKTGLFRKHKELEQYDVPENVALSGIRFGWSYVIFEPTPNIVYQFVSKFNPDAYDILIVTSSRPKAVRVRFRYQIPEIIMLSTNPKAGSMNVRELGALMVRIKSFIEEHEKPVVVFDNITDIAEANGLSSAITFMNQVTNCSTKLTCFAFSVNPEVLTDKDRNLLIKKMEVYRN